MLHLLHNLARFSIYFPHRRVGNLRKSQLIESHVRAQLIYQKQITDEGEFIHFDHHELKISSSHSHEDDRVLLHWPMTICHKFDRDSPFYRMGPREILTGKFEIIVTLEGIVESTGNSVQSRQGKIYIRMFRYVASRFLLIILKVIFSVFLRHFSCPWHILVFLNLSIKQYFSYR